MQDLRKPVPLRLGVSIWHPIRSSRNLRHQGQINKIAPLPIGTIRSSNHLQYGGLSRVRHDSLPQKNLFFSTDGVKECLGAAGVQKTTLSFCPPLSLPSIHRGKAASSCRFGPRTALPDPRAADVFVGVQKHDIGATIQPEFPAFKAARRVDQEAMRVRCLASHVLSNQRVALTNHKAALSAIRNPHRLADHGRSKDVQVDYEIAGLRCCLHPSALTCAGRADNYRQRLLRYRHPDRRHGAHRARLRDLTHSDPSMAVSVHRAQIVRAVIQIASHVSPVIYVVNLVRDQRHQLSFAVIALAQPSVTLKNLLSKATPWAAASPSSIPRRVQFGRHHAWKVPTGRGHALKRARLSWHATSRKIENGEMKAVNWCRMPPTTHRPARCPNPARCPARGPR